MNRKIITSYLILILLSAILFVAGIERVYQIKYVKELDDNPILEEGFRAMELDESFVNGLLDSDDIGEDIAFYLLEKNYAPINKLMWKQGKSWDKYLSSCQAIWNDLQCFPMKREDVSYENSWLAERTYGGKRGHEGCDLMTAENKAGVYPIYSMIDGVVTNKGWLKKGGYRIGITSPSGGYFYYAHLDSYADIEEGDKVKAGQLLGYAGDTGYGPEGTTGQFPVHLHLGIYIYPEGEEISVNPYRVLRFLENK